MMLPTGSAQSLLRVLRTNLSDQWQCNSKASFFPALSEAAISILLQITTYLRLANDRSLTWFMFLSMTKLYQTWAAILLAMRGDFPPSSAQTQSPLAWERKLTISACGYLGIGGMGMRSKVYHPSILSRLTTNFSLPPLSAHTHLPFAPLRLTLLIVP